MQATQFYTRLPIYKRSISELLAGKQYFTPVPSDWHVLITDIKNSTGAFENGRHEEVNLIATGSIISTLNLAQKADIEIPFFFGGDGATMIVPSPLLEPALKALSVHRENTLRNANLDLRVGSVPVSTLTSKGHSLTISRLYLSDLFSIPIVLGDGLTEAEAIIKGQSDQAEVETQDDALDLSGMECRWDRIKPAMTQHEVVCLLVTALDATRQASLYKTIFDDIDQIYGPYEKRNPVSVPKLNLSTSIKKLALETRTRLGNSNIFATAKALLLTAYGKWFFMKQEVGKNYLNDLVQLTDTLVLDGRVNTVIAGTREQRIQLEARLDALEHEGLIVYGIYTSRESVMSCYVQDYASKHIHFVDGSDGGYTMAAKMLKHKVRSRELNDKSPKR